MPKGKAKVSLACQFCAGSINPDAVGTYKLITGWVEVRRGGGAHSVELSSLPHGFAHGHCLQRQKMGGYKQVGLEL